MWNALSKRNQKEHEMNQAEKHLELLGHKATDKVTGVTGVITSVCFDLTGCIQAAVAPKATDDGTIPSSRWFDVPRLTIQTGEPVLEQPDFSKGYVAEGYKGPCDKPPL